jgi:hypothetical protein
MASTGQQPDNKSWASRRSVFCFRPRCLLISAASPIHTSKPNSASNRSNQREYPVASNPNAHADSSLLHVPIVLFCLTVAVMQSPFSALTSFLIHKRDLLNARVII